MVLKTCTNKPGVLVDDSYGTHGLLKDIHRIGFI